MKDDIKSETNYAIMHAMIELAQSFEEEINEGEELANSMINMILSKLKMSCLTVGLRPELYAQLSEKRKMEITNKLKQSNFNL